MRSGESESPPGERQPRRRRSKSRKGLNALHGRAENWAPRFFVQGRSSSLLRVFSVSFLTFGRLAALYRRHFRDPRRERLFLASWSFLVTFATARLMVHGFRARDRAFELWIAGIHVHHFVWGILVLLLVGYLWLLQIGSGEGGRSRRLGRFTALLYGVGAALTLDEFALWLHLDDVYWEQAGRRSLDAVVLFGALVSAGLWGGPFWRGVLCQVVRPWRRKVVVAPVDPIVEPAASESSAG